MARISETISVSVLVLAVVLSPLFCTPAPAAAESAVDDSGDDERIEEEDAEDPARLAGCYDLTGIDTEGYAYSGTLCIAVVGDLLYELTWTLVEEDEGLVVYDGRGVSGGDDLFAVWSESGPEYECYLHLFDIDSIDGSLHGLRVNTGGETSSQTGKRVGKELARDWSETGQLAGSYALESSDEYAGRRLKVTHLPVEGEDAYSFHWSGNTDLEGIGVREGNSIAVAANPVGQRGGTCGSISFTRVKDTRKLEGSYFTLGSLSGETPRKRGEETATPRE
jgi:hypothetical protein